MCDLAFVLQLADLDAQVLVERQVVGALAAAGRWPDGEEWPSVPMARRTFAERLNSLPEPPRELSPVDQERAELHRVLGVGRGG